MNMNGWKRIKLFASAGLFIALFAAPARGQDQSTVGVTRITDREVIQAGAVMEPIPDANFSGSPRAVPVINATTPCESGLCQQDTCSRCRSGIGDWVNDQMSRYRAHNSRLSSCIAARYRARNRQQSAALRNHLLCKFGYFIPTGCCGGGCPPIGFGSAVYAVDAGHFDGRDGRLYAAQGYGLPMAVPLAPTVGHTYNYSWGVPASRLTPIARIAP